MTRYKNYRSVNPLFDQTENMTISVIVTIPEDTNLLSPNPSVSEGDRYTYVYD